MLYKKIIRIISVLLAITCLPINIFAQGTDLSESLTIPQYNAYYAENQPNTSNMLSINQYNQFYNGTHLSGNIIDIFPFADGPLSEVKTQNKEIYSAIVDDGTVMGEITLQYQTQIVGGRPQFAYDTCYLSHPKLYTYWKLDESGVIFTGDKITVYFYFSFYTFSDYCEVVFKPV